MAEQGQVELRISQHLRMIEQAMRIALQKEVEEHKRRGSATSASLSNTAQQDIPVDEEDTVPTLTSGLEGSTLKATLKAGFTKLFSAQLRSYTVSTVSPSHLELNQASAISGAYVSQVSSSGPAATTQSNLSLSVEEERDVTDLDPGRERKAQRTNDSLGRAPAVKRQRYSGSEPQKRHRKRPYEKRQKSSRPKAIGPSLDPLTSGVPIERFNNEMTLAPMAGQHQHLGVQPFNPIFNMSPSTSRSTESQLANASVSNGQSANTPTSTPLNTSSAGSQAKLISPMSGSSDLLCPDCLRVIKGDRYNFQKHVNAVHRKFKPFTCDACRQRFSRQDNLRQHQKKVHNIIPLPHQNQETKGSSSE